jgi:hypothetical protein
MSHTQPVVATKKSIHFLISSRGRTGIISGRDGLPAGNGSFSTTIKNPYGVNKSTKVMAATASVPNVFPNLRDDAEVVLMNTTADIIQASFTVPSGWYTADSLLAYFLSNNFENTDTTQMLTLDVSTGKYLLTTDGDTYTLSMPPELFYMMGYNSEVSPETGGPADSDFVWIWEIVSGTYSDLPNFTGATVCHVLVSQLSNYAMITNFGGDSDYPPTAVSIPLNVPYGNMATYRSQGLFIDDLDFRGEADLSNLKVYLVDQYFRQLRMPINYDITIIFKVFHEDEDHNT